MLIKLVMDRERARHLQCALEVIARIGMGQFKDMVDFLKPLSGWSTGKEIEDYLKSKIYPDMSPQGYHGIKQNEVPIASRVAWDAYQHIRRELSWEHVGKNWRTYLRDWSEMCGVNFDDPMKASGLEGEFQTERIDDEEGAASSNSGATGKLQNRPARKQPWKTVCRKKSISTRKKIRDK